MLQIKNYSINPKHVMYIKRYIKRIKSEGKWVVSIHLMDSTSIQFIEDETVNYEKLFNELKEYI